MFITLRSCNVPSAFGMITVKLALSAVTIFLWTGNIWKRKSRGVLIVELWHASTGRNQKRLFTLLKKRTISYVTLTSILKKRKINCVLRSVLCTKWAIEVNILPDLTICVFDVSLFLIVGARNPFVTCALVRFQNLICLHSGAVKRVNDRFLCTRTVKALLLCLPFLIIRPRGFAIEFEYGIRPLIKPMIF